MNTEQCSLEQTEQDDIGFARESSRYVQRC